MNWKEVSIVLTLASVGMTTHSTVISPKFSRRYGYRITMPDLPKEVNTEVVS